MPNIFEKDGFTFFFITTNIDPFMCMFATAGGKLFFMLRPLWNCVSRRA